MSYGSAGLQWREATRPARWRRGPSIDVADPGLRLGCALASQRRMAARDGCHCHSVISRVLRHLHSENAGTMSAGTCPSCSRLRPGCTAPCRRTCWTSHHRNTPGTTPPAHRTLLRRSSLELRRIFCANMRNTHTIFSYKIVSSFKNSVLFCFSICALSHNMNYACNIKY